nr:DUF2163 domain-containing protein [Parvularcula maris]
MTEVTAQQFGRDGAALVYAVLILRSDGRALGLTDHDRDLAFTGQTFAASPGMSFDGLEQSADLAPDHAGVRTALHPDGITAGDIDAGRYAEAQVELWQVDADNTDARLLLLAGTLGEIERDGAEVNLELRAASERLNAPIGRLYQRSCSVQLGDDACGVDLSALGRSVEGTVEQESTQSIGILCSTARAPLDFAGGVLRIRTGELGGLERPIRTARTQTGGYVVSLWEALPRALISGDEVTLVMGCDKTFAACRDLFANAERFRGFPHIPGLAALAVQRSS